MKAKATDGGNGETVTKRNQCVWAIKENRIGENRLINERNIILSISFSLTLNIRYFGERSKENHLLP